ncbi:MAG: lysine--tRNA ligase [Actinomycetota bacterium]|nr:lysine--tRNA ligase [Actinomycetota bacterium]
MDERESFLEESKTLKDRRNKLDKLVSEGREPYKSKFVEPDELAHSDGLCKRYADLGAGELSGERVSVAGRIMAIREHGGATFFDLLDSSGRIQLLFRENILGRDRYRDSLNLDVGDIVGVTGEMMRSKRSELTVSVESFELLSKSLRPLPEKWHGLKDKEIRYRQRYLDLIMNEETRSVFKARTEIIKRIREFLDERGFTEVETPILQLIPGGASARPFVTHHNALDIDLYLRIAPELYLKRMLVGGYERVYELSRNFRNEGISTRHNPEFTMLEVYWAYADYSDMMRLVREMITDVVIYAKGDSLIEVSGEKIDLLKPWEEITMLESLSKYANLELSIEMETSELCMIAEQNDILIPQGAGPGWLIAELYEKLVEPKLVHPTFVLDYPEEISPLARGKADSPGFTERFEVLIGGHEIANAFSELADPLEQRRRFEEQLRKRALGIEEAHALDEDFLTALEYGMPPAGGLGLGVDRLTMLACGCASIRDVILFPHMRPQEGERRGRES